MTSSWLCDLYSAKVTYSNEFLSSMSDVNEQACGYSILVRDDLVALERRPLFVLPAASC